MNLRTSFLLVALFLGLTASAQSTVSGTADNNRKPIRESVSATAAQVSGKWNIVKILNPKQIELPSDKVVGSYFVFGDDQKYTAIVMGVEEKGDWKFGPENKSVHLFVNGMKTIWNILTINETEFVMQKGVRGNTVTFTR